MNTEKQLEKNKKASFWQEIWLKEKFSLFISLMVYVAVFLFLLIMEILTRRLLNHPYLGCAYFGLTSFIITAIIITKYMEKTITMHWRILCLNWITSLIYAIIFILFS